MCECVCMCVNVCVCMCVNVCVYLSMCRNRTQLLYNAQLLLRLVVGIGYNYMILLRFTVRESGGGYGGYGGYGGVPHFFQDDACVCGVSD
jgi:hypothetical protein